MSTQSSLTISDINESQRNFIEQVGCWRRFHRQIRSGATPLLAALPRYSDCVLVAGCQRSGTTMLTRILAGSSGFRSFRFSRDDELDAALILNGRIDLPADSRYCFQTTYLNEQYTEYRDLRLPQRLIWLIRNPHSVVYSMAYHWRRSAFKRLFDSCMKQAPDWDLERQYRRNWPFGLSRIERASIAYSVKTSQILSIRKLVPSKALLVLDYDQLVTNPDRWLPAIFEFIEEPYVPEYRGFINPDSLNKRERLNRNQRAIVDRIAMPAYEDCSRLVG